MSTLPFTHQQFMAVFAEYNQHIWPLQLIAYLLAVAALASVLRSWRHRDLGVLSVMALMWAWTGIAYHGIHFARINPAAFAFAAMFDVQAVLLAWAAARGTVQFTRRNGLLAWTGWSLIAYALIVYPLIAMLAFQRYPQQPMFGVTPCPVTIFTIGCLLLAERVPWRLLVIPGLWAMVGASAAWLLRVPEDWMLVAAVAALALVWLHDRREAGARAIAQI